MSSLSSYPGALASKITPVLGFSFVPRGNERCAAFLRASRRPMDFNCFSNPFPSVLRMNENKAEPSLEVLCVLGPSHS